MGKDKNKDKEPQDGETAASSKTITSPWDAHQSNRDLSQDWEARDAALAKTIMEAVAREMAKAHVQYQALLNDRSAAVIPTTLRLLQEHMVSRLWTPLTGPRTRLSTRDGNCGQKRLDLPLKLWKVTQKRLKISYFHHWINEDGMGLIESWKNSKTLIHQSEYDGLEERQKEGKYSSESIESYFTLSELLLAPKSNPLLAVEELHFAKQGSMTSGEFHSHIVKIAKRCQFPNPEAEERAIRDAIFLGMNSQWARDKAINLMNEEGKELTVEFLMNQLAVEDCNANHKSLSQLNSNSSMNFAAYNHRQNNGKSNKSK